MQALQLRLGFLEQAPGEGAVAGRELEIGFGQQHLIEHPIVIRHASDGCSALNLAAPRIQPAAIGIDHRQTVQR